MEAESLPKIVPPLPQPNEKALNLPRRTALEWFKAGRRDLWRNPLPSLLYGLAVFLCFRRMLLVRPASTYQAVFLGLLLLLLFMLWPTGGALLSGSPPAATR